MKTVKMKKKESNKIVVETPLPRMPRILQSGSTHKSAKKYNRRNGKKIENHQS